MNWTPAFAGVVRSWPVVPAQAEDDAFPSVRLWQRYFLAGFLGGF